MAYVFKISITGTYMVGGDAYNPISRESTQEFIVDNMDEAVKHVRLIDEAHRNIYKVAVERIGKQ